MPDGVGTDSGGVARISPGRGRRPGPRVVPRMGRVRERSGDGSGAGLRCRGSKRRTDCDLLVGAAPRSLWEDLGRFIPSADSAAYARPRLPPDKRQPELPITIRLDDSDGISVDTIYVAGDRSLRLVVDRVDTVSIRGPN